MTKYEINNRWHLVRIEEVGGETVKTAMECPFKRAPDREYLSWCGPRCVHFRGPYTLTVPGTEIVTGQKVRLCHGTEIVGDIDDRRGAA